MNQKSIVSVPDTKLEKPTRIIERIVVVGYSGNKSGARKPINRKVMISVVAVALVILAMLPVRTIVNANMGWYYDRPLIVWAFENVHENYFIWDPTQVSTLK